MNILDPDALAAHFRQHIQQEIITNSCTINIVGFLASHDRASEIYAQHTQAGCANVGINFELIKIQPNSIWNLMEQVNNDVSIHGILIYYPIFNDARDTQLRNAIAWNKDIEGLTYYWLNKLYANIRFDDTPPTNKAILPCTSLAIIKILETVININDTSLPTFHNKTISIFNRSEVVGKPLAFMLAHDGGIVYSFDINGGIIIDNDTFQSPSISRSIALSRSDIVITGVPSKQFQKIRANELKAKVIGLNFSHIQNFTNEAKEYANCYIPRVGTLTVAMCLRNAVRLYRNYHQQHFH